jgi:hypothetical protein
MLSGRSAVRIRYSPQVTLLQNPYPVRVLFFKAFYEILNRDPLTIKLGIKWVTNFQKVQFQLLNTKVE